MSVQATATAAPCTRHKVGVGVDVELVVPHAGIEDALPERTARSANHKHNRKHCTNQKRLKVLEVLRQCRERGVEAVVVLVLALPACMHPHTHSHIGASESQRGAYQRATSDVSVEASEDVLYASQPCALRASACGDVQPSYHVVRYTTVQPST